MSSPSRAQPADAGGSSVSAPSAEGLTPTLERNIRALHARRKREDAQATREERVAEAITRFAGSMRFVYLHLAGIAFWVVANVGWIPGVAPWDPTFVQLATIASVEAIFLTTFVLISQNRLAQAEDQRADLDLQISLLAEYEVTRLIAMVSAIAERLGVQTEVDQEVEELKRDVAPEAVLDHLEANEPKRG
jgi:uncharacterized membrane protein